MVAGCRYVKTGYGSSRRQKKFVMEKIWTCVLGGASGIAHGPLSGAILLSRGYEGSGLVGEKKKVMGKKAKFYQEKSHDLISL